MQVRLHEGGMNCNDVMRKAEAVRCYKAEKRRTHKEVPKLNVMPRIIMFARHNIYTLQECPHDWQMARLSCLKLVLLVALRLPNKSYRPPVQSIMNHRPNRHRHPIFLVRVFADVSMS